MAQIDLGLEAIDFLLLVGDLLLVAFDALVQFGRLTQQIARVHQVLLAGSGLLMAADESFRIGLGFERVLDSWIIKLLLQGRSAIKQISKMLLPLGQLLFRAIFLVLVVEMQGGLQVVLGGTQRIEGDVDGDMTADIIIDIAGTIPAEAGWFTL